MQTDRQSMGRAEQRCQACVQKQHRCAALCCLNRMSYHRANQWFLKNPFDSRRRKAYPHLHVAHTHGCRLQQNARPVRCDQDVHAQLPDRPVSHLSVHGKGQQVTGFVPTGVNQDSALRTYDQKHLIQIKILNAN